MAGPYDRQLSQKIVINFAQGPASISKNRQLFKVAGPYDRQLFQPSIEPWLPTNLVKILCKFRLVNHSLPIERVLS